MGIFDDDTNGLTCPVVDPPADQQAASDGLVQVPAYWAGSTGKVMFIPSKDRAPGGYACRMLVVPDKEERVVVRAHGACKVETVSFSLA